MLKVSLILQEGGIVLTPSVWGSSEDRHGGWDRVVGGRVGDFRFRSCVYRLCSVRSARKGERSTMMVGLMRWQGSPRIWLSRDGSNLRGWC